MRTNERNNFRAHRRNNFQSASNGKCQNLEGAELSGSNAQCLVIMQ